MKRASTLLVLSALALTACAERIERSMALAQPVMPAPLATPSAQSKDQSLSPAQTAMPSPAPGTTTSGSVAPDQGESPPAPELTPEERERLLQGTKIKDPRYIDDNPPSPPGLPLTPVPETQVAPCPQGPKSPTCD